MRVPRRPAGEADAAFLREVYASTRREELEQVPWTEEQKRVFLDGQQAAQNAFYREKFPGATLDVVLSGEEPAGRFWVDRRAGGIQILDLALLPPFRGRGLGTALVRELAAEADAGGKTLAIYLESWNPGRRLFERLGFRAIAEEGPYVLYERPPGASVLA